MLYEVITDSGPLENTLDATATMDLLGIDGQAVDEAMQVTGIQVREDG